VEASDPFATLPAPVGGVITLNPSTYYVFCGIVDIGANRIDCPSSSVIAGRDPMLDGITRTLLSPGPIVSFEEGGTIRDISIVAIRVTVAIRFGGPGLTPPIAQSCVVWNVALSATAPGAPLGGTGIQFRGIIGQAVISRVTAVGLASTVRQGIASALGASQIGALYCNQISTSGSPAGSTQIFLEGEGGQVAASACYFAALRGDVGISIPGPWGVCQFWGCYIEGTITPSAILDTVTGLTATTGTATQSEAVAMVGYDNSTTRGSISVFQPGGGVPTVTPVGVYVPVGNGAPAHPLYTLGASSVRFQLLGATAATQTIEYIGQRPYIGSVTVSLSVALAGGFITTARAIGARLLRNAAVVPDATWEGGFAPGAIAVTAGSVSFTTGITASPGSIFQIEIANLGATPGNLVVTGAEVSIA